MDDQLTRLRSKHGILHMKTDPVALTSSYKAPAYPASMDDSRRCSQDSSDDDCTPYRYTLLPVYHNNEASPTDTTSDTSDMLLPPSPCYQPEWIYRRLKAAENSVPDVPIDDTFWSSTVLPRLKVDKELPSINPSNTRHQPRRRGPSVSSLPSMSSTSTASSSSQIKAKSILTRTSSSASTKNSLGKSVKFVDIPTIHYHYDDYFEEEETTRPSSPPPPGVPSAKFHRRIKEFVWPSKSKATGRPVISAPLALGSVQSLVDRSENGSIRSNHSDGGTNFDRMRRKAPSSITLRNASSLESFRSVKPIPDNHGRFKNFFSKVVP